MKVCDPAASPEYEVGLEQPADVPASSWHAYELPLPPLKPKLAVALLLEFGGDDVIVGAVRTVNEPLAAGASQER